MKNSLVIASAVIIGISVFTSCKKCITCTFNSPITTKTYDKTCGSAKQVELYEQACISDAKANGGTCNCE